MKKEDPDRHEFFYMELPQTDYLDDIEIQDEYEEPVDQSFLSDEEVRKLAADSLRTTNQDPPRPPLADEHNLLSQGTTTS